ncbi:MAG: TolB family protein [Tepidisphaeraceae bacterium]
MTMIAHRNPLAWLAAGTALVALTGSAGCTRIASCFRGIDAATAPKPYVPPAPVAQGSNPPVTETSPTSTIAHPPPPGDSLFATELPPVETKAPTVNVFGELDGVERRPGPASGEAGFQQHTFLTEGADADASLDPAGRWIVFTSTRHAEHPKIYLQRVDGHSVTQLTSDQADDANPSFSPDGRQIAFASTRGGNWDIYVMDVDGKNVVQLTHGPMQDLHPSFSPDGSRLVYCSLGARGNNWELWTLSLTTGESRMIGHGIFPVWCPAKTDGGVDRIAFQKARQRGSRWFSLWTLDLIDGEARRVTEVAVSSNAAIVSPAWSPDGRKLAFASVVEPARGAGVRQQDVWVINADGSGRQRVTDGNGSNLNPFWAVDHRVFFVSDRGGTDCVWSARINGMSGTKVAETKHEEEAKETVGSTDASEVEH